MAPLSRPSATLPKASFMRLPREIRDQIYDYTFAIPDDRSQRELRIERRNVKHFIPSAAAILLICHHEYLVLSRSIALEALEVLFKRHTVLFSCGPYVLKTLLTKIEHERSGQGKKWLKWLKHVELCWTTFPNLRAYPPERLYRDLDQVMSVEEKPWENVDLSKGARGEGYFDEYDCEGAHYNDNLYSPDDPSLYPLDFMDTSDPADSSSLSPFYPIVDHSSMEYNQGYGEGYNEGYYPEYYNEYDANNDEEYDEEYEEEYDEEYEEGNEERNDEANEMEDHNVSRRGSLLSKMNLLVEREMTPLFDYMCTPTFAFSSIRVSLYFIREEKVHLWGPVAPWKQRYHIQLATHAIMMLLQDRSSGSPYLNEVIIKYRPWDLHTYMQSPDNLARIEAKGIWFDEDEAEVQAVGHDTTPPIEEFDSDRSKEGLPIRAVWAGLAENGISEPRSHLSAKISRFQWDGDLETEIGDYLEISLTRA